MNNIILFGLWHSPTTPPASLLLNKIIQNIRVLIATGINIRVKNRKSFFISLLMKLTVSVMLNTYGHEREQLFAHSHMLIRVKLMLSHILTVSSSTCKYFFNFYNRNGALLGRRSTVHRRFSCSLEVQPTSQPQRFFRVLSLSLPWKSMRTTMLTAHSIQMGRFHTRSTATNKSSPHKSMCSSAERYREKRIRDRGIFSTVYDHINS